jgi:hypothetical protein
MSLLVWWRVSTAILCVTQHVARVVQAGRVRRRPSCRRPPRLQGPASSAEVVSINQAWTHTTWLFTSATNSLRAAVNPRLAACAKPVFALESQDLRVGLLGAQEVDRTALRAVVDHDHFGGQKGAGVAIAPRQARSQ